MMHAWITRRQVKPIGAVSFCTIGLLVANQRCGHTWKSSFDKFLRDEMETIASALSVPPLKGFIRLLENGSFQI